MDLCGLSIRSLDSGVQWYLRHPDYSKLEGELTFNLLPSSHAVSGGFSEKQFLRQGVLNSIHINIKEGPWN